FGELFAFGAPGPFAAGAPPGTASRRDDQAAADLAGALARLLADREVAVRVPVARIERPAEPVDPFGPRALRTLRARHARPLRFLLLDVLAVGVPRAADELAVAAHAFDQLALAALRAGLARRLRLRRAVPLGQRPGVPALRVLVAPDEHAVPAQPLDQLAGFAPLLRAQRARLAAVDL